MVILKAVRSTAFKITSQIIDMSLCRTNRYESCLLPSVDGSILTRFRNMMGH